MIADMRFNKVNSRMSMGNENNEAAKRRIDRGVGDICAAALCLIGKLLFSVGRTLETKSRGGTGQPSRVPPRQARELYTSAYHIV